MIVTTYDLLIAGNMTVGVQATVGAPTTSANLATIIKGKTSSNVPGFSKTSLPATPIGAQLQLSNPVNVPGAAIKLVMARFRGSFAVILGTPDTVTLGSVNLGKGFNSVELVPTELAVASPLAGKPFTFAASPEAVDVTALGIVRGDVFTLQSNIECVKAVGGDIGMVWLTAYLDLYWTYFQGAQSG